jgi:hypothetical protein
MSGFNFRGSRFEKLIPLVCVVALRMVDFVIVSRSTTRVKKVNNSYQGCRARLRVD